jgi:hypothetical protein
LTFSELRDEAKARQLDPKAVPKRKADLIHRLGDGSIHVRESHEYKAYQILLDKVEGERAASLQKKQEADVKQKQLDLERQAKEEKKQEEERRRKEVARQKEVSKQMSLHVHSFPRVHPCPLAKSSTLMNHGIPRNSTGVSCLCHCCSHMLIFSTDDPSFTAAYSCDSCDWDICQRCFEEGNKDDAEKRQILLQRRQQEDERRRQEEERRQESEEARRWNARRRFKSTIISPPEKHLNPHSTQFKYTVWCSDGYDNDGWHSYEGEPAQEFDSMWNTEKEANDRAEFLFFWKNSYGLAPNLLSDDNGEPDNDIRNGLYNWSVAPADSTRWSVGVVPTVAFAHLPRTPRRHVTTLTMDLNQKEDTKSPPLTSVSDPLRSKMV